ncbi:MAG: translation elongation factor Ts [bacterium]|nr:translation elongation factor Ts [bacterium]
MAYTAADIKKLREETGAGMMDCKKALDEAGGEYDQARELVFKRGLAKAEKKSDRETNIGFITSYVHGTAQVGAMVEILCETDFVARNPEFQAMAKDIAMQVVALSPADTTELLAQENMKNPDLTIEETIKSLSGKIGEKFVLNRFVRYQVGE